MRMFKPVWLLPALLLAACAHFATDPDTLVPPVAPVHPYDVKSPQGTRVDNYYWLRDDTRTSREVLDYLAAENRYHDAWMAHDRPLEDKLYREIVGRIKEDDSTPPALERGYWYYTRFEAGGEYPVYARRKGKLDAPEEILLDGNRMGRGKAFFSIGQYEISDDNQLLAYTEDDIGRRQYTLHVRNLATGETYADAVGDIDPGIAWAADNRTVLYVDKDPETLLGLRVKKHVLGTDAKADALVYEEPDHAFYIGVARSKSQKYLLINSQSTLVSEWRYAEAAAPDLKFRVVLPREPNHEYQVEHRDRDFIIRTNWKAPNFRIVRAPIATSADKRSWRDVVPHRSDAFVETYDVFQDHLAVNERSGGLLKIRVLPWNGGKAVPIAADEPAYVMELGTTPEMASTTLRYTYGSLTTPETTWDYDMRTGGKTLVKRQAVLGGYDPANYVTEYLHATARDGALVPVSILHRKDFKRDGTAFLYQYGYGSYGLSTDPYFRSAVISLVDRGGVFAVAHVRGGQELGRKWYEDGKLLHKKNTFTDFVDVTDFLVREGWCAERRTFASGGSAGGLLMGAIANLAPGHYAGIVAHVPFVDVVTTMLDESIPLTTNEFDEWGNPKQKQYYDYMLGYSPYDNVADHNYPAMLVTTGLWDSQVQYYEPAKWVAKLRAVKTDQRPLLFHVNMEAGHGGKSGRYERYREIAQEYAFVLDRAGIHD
jgi:oligopeptidase B